MQVTVTVARVLTRINTEPPAHDDKAAHEAPEREGGQSRGAHAGREDHDELREPRSCRAFSPRVVLTRVGDGAVGGKVRDTGDITETMCCDQTKKERDDSSERRDEQGLQPQ